MQPKITITEPADVLAAIPYLVGEPPQCGLVGLVSKGGRVHLSLAKDLDDANEQVTVSAAAGRLVGIALTEGDALMLIAYGPGPRVTPLVDAVLSLAHDRRLTILDALRVNGNRYWSYTCQADCCPAQGVLFDPDRSVVPAEMVVRGVTRHPAPADPVAEARRSLAPVDLPPEEVKAIVADTVAAAQRWADPVARAAEQLMRAVDAEKTGRGPQEVTELVRLAVFARSIPARDRVWAAITPETAPVHIDLWSRVTRTAPRQLRPAPAALVAAAAWTIGELPLAQAGVRAALNADPAYSLAQLIQQALTFGMPAQAWMDKVRKQG